MIIYATLGFLFGMLNVYLIRRIHNGIAKVLAGIALYLVFGVIASSMLYGEMMKSAQSQLRLMAAAGIYLNRDEYVQRKISRWNGTIYSGEFFGIAAAYFYFSSKTRKEKHQKEKQEEAGA